MKDFFEKIIQPEVDEMDRLLAHPVPYIRYSPSYPLHMDACNHLDVRYVEKTMTLKGNSILVMEPFCESCNRFVGEEE